MALFVIIAAIVNIFDFHPEPMATKLSYKQFVDYYWVNPNRWFLWGNYVEYIYIDKRIFTNGGAHEKFTFSFFDILKYKKFKYDVETNKEKQHKLKTDKEAYQVLLEGVQKDIDKLRQQSENELNQAMNILKEVKERIG